MSLQELSGVAEDRTLEISLIHRVTRNWSGLKGMEHKSTLSTASSMSFQHGQRS